MRRGIVESRIIAVKATDMKKKIFIDTDAGTDDAVAIVMALESPHFEVVGISCVGGNASVDQVAQNVLYLCDKLDQEIPVYVGADKPLTRPLKSSDFIHGSDGFGDIGIDNHGRLASSINAVEGLRRAIMTHPHELTVVTLGPLTNVAMALQQYPELAALTSELHIMGGNYQMPGNITPVSEYNFWADPEAADQCILAEIPKTIVGWDITLRHGYLRMEELEALLQGGHPLCKEIVQMQRVRLDWLRSNGQVPVCTWADAAAMLALIEPKYSVEQGAYFCQVVTSGDTDDTRGMMIVDVNHQKSNEPNAQVVINADRELFKSSIYKTFNVK